MEIVRIMKRREFVIKNNLIITINNLIITMKNVFFIFCMMYLFCFIYGCSQITTPATFLNDPAVLVANRQKINAGDQVLTESLAGLKAEADKALTEGPYSVTYKTKIPPSGDKHDYMSMGPYWWPDTTKPGGLPYIQRDGVTNPERLEITDAAYFSALRRNVRILALARYFTGEEKYANRAAELLRVWFLDETTRMNPHLNYGQGIPGISEGRAMGLIDMRQTVYLIDGIQILKACNGLTAAEYDGLQRWFGQFLDWMTTSPIGLDEADQHNNHGTFYDVTAVSIALFTGQKENARRMLEEKTKARIESQFAEDGSQPHELGRTKSWTYSQMNLSGFFNLAGLAKNVDMDLWNYVSPGGKSIKKAFLWMLPFANGLPWEYPQIVPVNKSVFTQLVQIAAEKYPDVVMPDYLLSQKMDELFVLTY